MGWLDAICSLCYKVGGAVRPETRPEQSRRVFCFAVEPGNQSITRPGHITNHEPTKPKGSRTNMTHDAAPKKSGRFGKGNPGKPKGATSKVTRELKALILGALDDAGGQQYLAERARDPRTASAFLTPQSNPHRRFSVAAAIFPARLPSGQRSPGRSR